MHIITKEDSNRFGAGLLLGVAYSASIGGIATLVGTPPNLSFVRIFHYLLSRCCRSFVCTMADICFSAEFVNIHFGLGLLIHTV